MIDGTGTRRAPASGAPGSSRARLALLVVCSALALVIGYGATQPTGSVAVASAASKAGAAQAVSTVAPPSVDEGCRSRRVV